MKKPIPFKELYAFTSDAIDKIYNESGPAREAVIKHFGLWHYPFNEKFRRFRRKHRAQPK